MNEFTGGCTCRSVRYRLTAEPMIVHCCHCRWCQRETGASFALNAMIEFDRVELLGIPAGAPAFEEYYDSAKLWPPESLARRAALIARKPK